MCTVSGASGKLCFNAADAAFDTTGEFDDLRDFDAELANGRMLYYGRPNGVFYPTRDPRLTT